MLTMWLERCCSGSGADDSAVAGKATAHGAADSDDAGNGGRGMYLVLGGAA